MTSLVRQLHDAWVETGWSARTLLEKTGLDCDRTSMGRKIRGQQSISAVELEAVARVLGRRIIVQPIRAKAA